MFLVRQLMMARPRIVIHEFSAGILSKPLLLLFCKLTNKRIIFWGHMYDRSQGFFPGKRLSDKYRLWLWRRADSLITYSQAEKQLLLDYGIPGKKIFVAYNTVDTSAFLRVRDQLERTGRLELKKRLGFQHEFNLTFIGRLYREKKPELLLDLLTRLKQMNFASVAIHYIGEGEMISSLKKQIADLGLEDDVYFHGAVYDEQGTGEMLFCSDLMIMPGCVGLSVNHAFCFNCPVVTFKEINQQPAHGPEIEYIRDGQTGFLIPDHSVDTLAGIVADYLHSAGLQASMRSQIRKFIETERSLDRMASGVIQAIRHNLTCTA